LILKIKNIILIYFKIKNILKNNRYDTPKHSLAPPPPHNTFISSNHFLASLPHKYILVNYLGEKKKFSGAKILFLN